MKAALTLFTVIPARVDGKDVEELSRRFHLIVLVGLLYGLLAGGIMYLGAEFLPGMVVAALALAVMHLLNRFLHLDGLSDLGDGMVCGGSAERRMAAMKDSKTGAGGVGYVMVFSLLSFAALSSLNGIELLFIPLVAEMMNKNAVVLCAARGKAREGLGNMFITGTGGRQAAISIIMSAVLSFTLLIAFGFLLDIDWAWWTYLILVSVAALVSSIVGVYMARLAERNFGAVNGDVLGATNEICRALVLISMLLVVA